MSELGVIDVFESRSFADRGNMYFSRKVLVKIKPKLRVESVGVNRVS